MNQNPSNRQREYVVLVLYQHVSCRVSSSQSYPGSFIHSAHSWIRKTPRNQNISTTCERTLSRTLWWETDDDDEKMIRQIRQMMNLTFAANAFAFFLVKIILINIIILSFSFFWERAFYYPFHIIAWCSCSPRHYHLSLFNNIPFIRLFSSAHTFCVALRCVACTKLWQ